MATGIKDIAKGRSDTYRVRPADLHVKDGWNGREDDDPANVEHIDGLAKSIAEMGVKEALAVYMEDGKLFVSNGHCRRAAALKAIEEYGADPDMLVPVITEPRDATEADRIFSQIVRNSGKQFSPLEQGRVFKRLVDLGWNDSEIGRKAGVSRVHVASLIALVEAPKSVTNLVRSGEVSATLAISTLKKNKGDTKAAASELKGAVKEAKKAGKSRATAKHVKPKAPTAPKAPKVAALPDLEDENLPPPTGRYRSAAMKLEEIEKIVARCTVDDDVAYFSLEDFARLKELATVTGPKPTDDLV